MNEQRTRSLRDLARDHYLGRMTREEYLYARRKLIDLATGQPAAPVAAAPDTTVPHARRRSRDEPGSVPSITRAADLAPEAGATGVSAPGADAAVPAPAPAQASRPPYAAIGIGAVIAVAIVAVLFAGADKSETMVAAPGVETPSPVAQPPAEVLLLGFADEPLWTDAHLHRFLTAWDALPENDRQAARGTSAYLKLQRKARERVLELQALLDADAGGTHDIEAGRILSLARHLGFTPVVQMFANAPPAHAVGAPAAESAPAAVTAPEAKEARAETPEVTIAASTSPDENRSDISAQPVEPDTATAPASSTAPVSAAPVADPAARVEPPQPDTRDKAVKQTATEDKAGVTRADADACHSGLANSRRSLCRDSLGDGAQGPLLTVLRGGQFSMGSAQSQEESPPHSVQIVRPFAISVYEISYADYRLYCTAAGIKCPTRTWGSDRFPIVSVSWTDANGYVAWLSETTGARYRLPSEAEWEYAARGGRTTVYPFGDSITLADARYASTAPLAVDDATVNRNDFKLFHIVGNVREWVQDRWNPTHQGAPGDGSVRQDGVAGVRVVRGGSYGDAETKLRASAREGLPEGFRDIYTGFRVVRELER